MRRSVWIVLVIVVALGGLIGYQRISAPLLSDEQQIRTLLAEGEKAVERRSIKAALDSVSKDYSDPTGFNRDGLRLQVIEAFRTADGYDVSVQTEGIQVAGDTAEVQTEVAVVSLQKGDRHEVFSGPVTIRLAREPGRRYLVFPTKTWKVVGMSGLPLSSPG